MAYSGIVKVINEELQAGLKQRRKREARYAYFQEILRKLGKQTGQTINQDEYSTTLVIPNTGRTHDVHTITITLDLNQITMTLGECLTKENTTVDLGGYGNDAVETMIAEHVAKMLMYMDRYEPLRLEEEE